MERIGERKIIKKKMTKNFLFNQITGMISTKKKINFNKQKKMRIVRMRKKNYISCLPLYIFYLYFVYVVIVVVDILSINFFLNFECFLKTGGGENATPKRERLFNFFRQVTSLTVNNCRFYFCFLLLIIFWLLNSRKQL